jgi:hypothetical protein
MGALLFAYAMGLFFVLTPLLGRHRLARMVSDADEQTLIGLRRSAETRWVDYQLGIWAFLVVVGAIFLLVRGHAIGWAWFGVAVLYVAGIATARLARRRLLRELGDRGHVERPERYKARSAQSFHWLAAGATGYVGLRIVQYAYPHDPPPGAAAALGICGALMVVGVVGFLVIRARMYWSGDDLEPAP